MHNKDSPVTAAGAAEKKHPFQGRHLLVNYFGCDARALADTHGIMNVMTRAVLASGATILKTTFHEFSPQGMTGLLLLSESHAGIHTYPQYGACFIDLFTCGTKCSAEAFDCELRAFLKPSEISRRVFIRHERIEEDVFKG